MKHFATLLLLLFFAAPAAAQERVYLPPATPEREQVEATVSQGPTILDATEKINRRPEAREALIRFHELRETGQLPSAKSFPTYSIGDSASFNVIININNDSTFNWVSKTFILRGASESTDPAQVQIWVEKGELETGNVGDAQIASLREALIQKTPEESYNPQQGIIANNNEIFGNPPDVDGDGHVDILLYDITEGTDDCCVLGFVSTQDFFPSDGRGNGSEILYLDTNPGASPRNEESLLATAAHEYQHLIHFGFDPDEFTFVNEGLSEWAENLNGFRPRTIRYLGETTEHGRPLLGWRSDGTVSETDRDYQRAGLLTSYFAERVGPIVTGKVASSTILNGRLERPARGAAAYSAALSSQSGLPTFEEILADFHTANFFNDQNLDSRFGYLSDYYRDVHAVATAASDGRTVANTPQREVTLEGGGVQYYIWEKVSNLVLSLDVNVADVFLDAHRSYLRPRVILEYADGIVEVRDDVPLGPEPTTFSGSFDQIVVIIPHVRPDMASVNLVYSATWGSSAQYTTEEVKYDNGSAVSSSFFSLSSAGNGAMATRFVLSKPDNTILDKVSIAPYFLNQFFDSNNEPIGSPSDPRDLELKVWASNGNNAPGQEIFSLDVVDPRSYANATVSLDFFEVDLSEYAAQLSDLPDTIFVGYTELGTDTNYLVAGVSSYTAENLSFIGFVGDSVAQWQQLWKVQFQGGGGDDFPVENTIIPVRVSYLISSTPVAAEDDPTLPTEIVLHSNYPNPFNPSTAIRYELPGAGAVRLVVYDVMGRQVAMLVNGVQAAGMHEVQLDATNWASGLYFYTLYAGSQSVTRKMVLTK